MINTIIGQLSFQLQANLSHFIKLIFLNSDENLDFGNWDTVLYKFEKVVQKEAPMNSLISEIPTHFVQALYFQLNIIITYYYHISIYLIS